MSESIQQVSKRYGVSVATLRYYDELGLLPRLTRNSSGYRQFNEVDCSDLEMVICFRHLGLGVKEIASVMAPVTDDTARNRKLDLIEKQKQRLLAQAVDLQMGLLMIAIKERIYRQPEIESRQHARTVIRKFVDGKIRSSAPDSALELTLADSGEVDWFAAEDWPVISRVVRLYGTVRD